MQTKTKEAVKFKVVRNIIIPITVKYMQLFHSDFFFCSSKLTGKLNMPVNIMVINARSIWKRINVPVIVQIQSHVQDKEDYV